jgi:hypothetical protein
MTPAKILPPQRTLIDVPDSAWLSMTRVHRRRTQPDTPLAPRQLFVRPFRVAHDGAWAQYIKAHAPGEKAPRHAVIPEPGVPFDAGDLGLCRLCPEFTALYG